jgi:arylsulfatase A-like enzyme/Tfp pilus assembly protein PilF
VILKKTAALLLFALVLQLPEIWAQPGAKRTTPNRPHPNVILITMDTLRADHVGCYGSKDVATPTLDALARDGVVFDRAIAQVPLTWPSHAAILTGTYPFQNGVQDFTGHPLEPQFRSVAQSFKQAGYATGAVVSSFVLDRSWGLARGFDFYDDAFSASAFQQKDLGLVDRKAEQSVAHALKWLEKTQKRPFFLWLHLYDPHSPYDPPEPYRTQYKDRLYDGEITYADHELGRLVTWLKSHALYDNSLIVFVSDHGESLGDHGEREHGFFIYNATTQVPLIVKAPAARHVRPGRTTSPIETIAIAPTLLDASSVHDSIERQLQARSLLTTSSEEGQEAYSETFYPFSSFGWSPLHSLETARYHYIDAPQPELYDVRADPAEKDNLLGQQPAVAAVMKAKIGELLRRRPFEHQQDTGARLNPDAAERLRALGYVAYQSPVSAEALAAGLPDPKSKLWEFNAILQAQDAFHANDFSTGEDLLAKVRESDPQMYLVPFMLGEAALHQQKWPEAAKEMTRCLELNPNFDQAMTGLARALAKQGQSVDAKKWLEKALDQNSQNFRAWYELGWVESSTGNHDQARVAYKKVLLIQPNFALAQRDLGMLYFEDKDYTRAIPYLARTIELGLAEPSVFNSLGICYSRTNQLQKAVENYSQALKLDPELAQAHLNLAYAYQRLNRARAAQKEYETACGLKEEFCQFVPGH